MQELVDAWQKSIRTLAIECSILSILHDRDMSESELKTKFKDRTKGVEMLIGANPCHSLRSMESRGLISTCRTGNNYHITKKGAAWLRTIVSSSNTYLSRA